MSYGNLVDHTWIPWQALARYFPFGIKTLQMSGWTLLAWKELEYPCCREIEELCGLKEINKPFINV